MTVKSPEIALALLTSQSPSGSSCTRAVLAMTPVAAKMVASFGSARTQVSYVENAVGLS